MNSVDIYGDKELIKYMNRSISKLKPQIIKGLKEAAKLVEKESKNKIGTYQRGWPKLKLATVLAKYNRRQAANGFKRAKTSFIISLLNVGLSDDPLRLFGKLRNSIKHEIDRPALEAIIYSDQEYAAVQEYGHKNVPARSYLRLTLWDEEDNISKIIDKEVGDIL